MNGLPEPLADFGVRAELALRQPAWLRVGADGRVSEVGGDLRDYGLAEVIAGCPAVEVAAFLQGVLPLEEELTLPFLRMGGGRLCDVHLIPETAGDAGVWVLLLRASGEAELRIRFQQARNELMLDLERSGEVDLERVMRALRIAEPSRGETAANGGQPWARPVSDLLGALNVFALERVEGSRFRPLGDLPDRFARRFPRLRTGSVDLAEEFAYLEHFIDEAEETWRVEGGAPRRSGIWTENDQAGKPCRMEATALRKAGRELLLLSLVDDDHDSLGGILQAAREHSLAFEELRRAQAELEVARRDLEQRVVERTEQLRQLADQLTFTEERERRRIANVLHDHIGQNLAVAKIQLGVLGEATSSPAIAGEIQRLRSVIEETIVYTRTLTFELAPPALYELGLDAALDSLIRRADEDSPFAARFFAEGGEKAIDDNVRTVLFQAVRELLHNIVKHAQPSEVVVSSALDRDQIVVTVEDDGVGFVLDSGAGSRTMSGFGLFNIRERMEHLGGSCEIRSEPGVGTRVVLRAPTRRRDEGEESR